MSQDWTQGPAELSPRARALAALVSGWREIVAWYGAALEPELLVVDGPGDWSTADYAAARSVATALVIDHPDSAQAERNRTDLDQVLPLIFPWADQGRISGVFEMMNSDWVPGEIHGWLGTWDGDELRDPARTQLLSDREHALVEMLAADFAAALLLWQSGEDQPDGGVSAIPWPDRLALRQKAERSLGFLNLWLTSEPPSVLMHELDVTPAATSSLAQPPPPPIHLVAAVLPLVPLTLTAPEFDLLQSGPLVLPSDDGRVIRADEAGRVQIWGTQVPRLDVTSHFRQDILGFHRLVVAETDGTAVMSHDRPTSPSTAQAEAIATDLVRALVA